MMTMIKNTRFLLMSTVLVLLLAVLLYTKLPLRNTVFFAAVFNNPNCGIFDGLAAHKVYTTLISKTRLKETTQLIAEDHVVGLELRRTRMGNIWIPANDVVGLAYVLGEREADIYGHSVRPVQKGDIVLDCGAYVGTFASKALEAGAKLVVAIEPVPQKIECLRRNFPSEIQAGRLIVYPKGVWDKEETLPLHKHAAHSGGDSFVLDRRTTSEKLQLTTIDRLVEELKLERVDFIKMDIEGAEIKALRGAGSTIRAYHPALALAVYHQPTDRQEIPREVRGLWSGYKSECGVCQLKDGKLTPDIMCFY